VSRRITKNLTHSIFFASILVPEFMKGKTGKLGFLKGGFLGRSLWIGSSSKSISISCVGELKERKKQKKRGNSECNSLLTIIPFLGSKIYSLGKLIIKGGAPNLQIVRRFAVGKRSLKGRREKWTLQTKCS